MSRRPLVLVPLLVAAGLFSLWRLSWSDPAAAFAPSPLPRPVELRSWDEHDAIRAAHGEPYVLATDTLLYYGGAHVRDPEHPQLADVAARWDAFGPTVALCEGRAGYLYRGPLGGLDGISDPEQVHALARRDGIPLYSLEPTYADEVAALLESWTPEQVALAMFLRVWRSEHGDAEELLAARTDVEGLRGALRSLDDVDRLWQRDFPGEPDWREADGEPEYLAAIADTSRQVRGEHMVATLVDLVRRGERVFAVVGSGHVIRQEPALRAALDGSAGGTNGG